MVFNEPNSYRLLVLPGVLHNSVVVVGKVEVDCEVATSVTIEV